MSESLDELNNGRRKGELEEGKYIPR